MVDDNFCSCHENPSTKLYVSMYVCMSGLGLVSVTVEFSFLSSFGESTGGQVVRASSSVCGSKLLKK